MLCRTWGQPGSSKLCTLLTTQGPAWSPKVSPAGHPTPPEPSVPTQCGAASSGSPFPSPKLVWHWLRGQWKGAHGRREEMPHQHITRRKITLESMSAKEGNNQIWNVGLLYDSTTLERIPFGGWEKWHTHLIPELGRQRQVQSQPGSHTIFQDSQIYMRPCLTHTNKIPF